MDSTFLISSLLLVGVILTFVGIYFIIRIIQDEQAKRQARKPEITPISYETRVLISQPPQAAPGTKPPAPVQQGPVAPVVQAGVVPPVAAPPVVDAVPPVAQAPQGLVERSPILDNPQPIVEAPETPAAITNAPMADTISVSKLSDHKSSYGVRYSGSSANRVIRDKRRRRNAG
jgi:hypothetical protein